MLTPQASRRTGSLHSTDVSLIKGSGWGPFDRVGVAIGTFEIQEGAGPRD